MSGTAIARIRRIISAGGAALFGHIRFYVGEVKPAENFERITGLISVAQTLHIDHGVQTSSMTL